MSSLTREPSFATVQRLLDQATISCANEEDLRGHFRKRSEPRFFAAFDDPQVTVEALRRNWPDREANIIAQAERALEGKFSLLGHSLDFGNPIDWCVDPIRGIRAPGDHWSRVPFLSSRIVGDHKLIWELNRHQHFVRLGQAYWLTGDERYAIAFATQIENWIEANPPQRGMNWVSSLELSLRSIAWLWALHFFRSSPELTPRIFRRILGSLYLHGRHIERYLSTYFSPNTHLSGEALGLLYLGVMLRELRCSERWRTLGSSILIELLDRHVLSDGVYFERASYYQRYTAEIYLHALLLSDRNGLGLRETISPVLCRLIDHLAALERPDGLTPLVGDDDGGRILPVGDPASKVADFRSTLCLGGAALDNPELLALRVDTADEAMWLVGASRTNEILTALHGEKPKAIGNRSRAFAEGGYYVLRDASGPHGNYALFDCGPLGTHNCGHAHADALALEICANGVPMCVDAGTYTYVAAETRDHFRGTGAHNTVLVDGQASSIPDGPFSWRHVAQAHTLRWVSNERFDFVHGFHNGFHRLSSPATHRRSVLFLKGDYWLVRDEVASMGPHRLEVRWHLAPSVRVIEQEGTRVLLEGTSGRRTGRLTLESLARAQCSYAVEQAGISPGFGELAVSSVLSLKIPAEGGDTLVTLLLPEASTEMTGGQTGSPHLASVPVERGSLWKVTRKCGITDLVMYDSCRSPHENIEVDGECAWLRRGPDSLIREFLLIGGRRLQYSGALRVEAARYCGYICGVLQGATWSITSDTTCMVQVQTGDDACAVFAAGETIIEDR